MKKLSTLFQKHEIESIYSAANSSVWHSHQHAHFLAKGSVREEDFVCILVTDGVNHLANSWAAILNKKGISVNIAGVFVHAHPQVTWDGI